MTTIKQIESKTMSPEKRAMASNDYFAFYIGRPLSYLLTIPFLKTDLSPNQISVLSIIPLVVGFVVMYLSNSIECCYWGWGCFFLWNVLDGVDGNVARYREQFSKKGSVYDAMSGYVAMVLSPFAWGIAAAHFPGSFQNLLHLPLDAYVILGAFAGVFEIFPRLVMHKTITTIGNVAEIEQVKNKSRFGFFRIIFLNITSVAGMMQVFMLVAIFFKSFDLFTLFYFCINGMVMLASLFQILRERK